MGAMDQITAHTSEEYLNMANKHLALSPPDDTKAAEDLWWGAVRSVVDLALKVGLRLKTQRSLSEFTRYVLGKLPNTDMDLVSDLSWGWCSAEELYSVVYGSRYLFDDDWERFIDETKFFIEHFPKIDPELIDPAGFFQEADKRYVTVTEEAKSVEFCQQNLNCQYAAK